MIIWNHYLFWEPWCTMITAGTATCIIFSVLSVRSSVYSVSLFWSRRSQSAHEGHGVFRYFLRAFREILCVLRVLILVTKVTKCARRAGNLHYFLRALREILCVLRVLILVTKVTKCARRARRVNGFDNNPKFYSGQQ